jgi:hypothetical protein
MFGFMKNNDKMHAFAKSRTLWQKANLARAALGAGALEGEGTWRFPPFLPCIYG